MARIGFDQVGADICRVDVTSGKQLMPLTARKGKDKHGNALKDDRALSVRLGAESVVLAAADVPDLVVDEYAFNFGKEVVRHALSPGTPVSLILRCLLRRMVRRLLVRLRTGLARHQTDLAVLAHDPQALARRGRLRALRLGAADERIQESGVRGTTDGRDRRAAQKHEADACQVPRREFRHDVVVGEGGAAGRGAITVTAAKHRRQVCAKAISRGERWPN